MADQQVTPPMTSQVADQQQQVTPPMTSQVTSLTPATKPKNPKRVAAGKLIAARTKKAREEQKIKLIRAESTIAKMTDPQPADPQPADSQPADPQPVSKNVLSTTQWLSVISIVVSLAGIYYKREEIKGLLTQKPQALPQAPSPDPPKAGIKNMD